MPIEIPEETRTHVLVLFASLNDASAAHSIPRLGSLSKALAELFPNKEEVQHSIGPEKAKYFATASVESWHRSIHSLLVSCSLTTTSPIWASVSGYYSSHYAMRALAHLLGYMLLFERKLVICATLERGAHHCHSTKKDGNAREHQFYWKVVKENACFATDPLFTRNADNLDISDSAHRNRANYADHIGKCPTFTPLSAEVVKTRLELISSMEMTDPPIPDRRQFPDVESVQLVAYHRLVRYRKLLDQILGGENRFWNVQRKPPFALGYCDYQVTESQNLEVYR